MHSPAISLGALDMTCLAAPTVAADARHRIALRLSAWGLMRLSGDVQLIAAELIANACSVTPDGRIRVRFEREPRAVLLAVWDGSGRMPRARPARELRLEELDCDEENFDRNGGWGLQLVQALSSECGVNRTDPAGKWVWSRLIA